MAYNNRTIELLIVISAKQIMVQLTTEQRSFIVLQYNRNENTTEVQNAFRARFPDRDPPAHKATILRNELRQQPDFVRRVRRLNRQAVRGCVLCSSRAQES